MKKRLIIKRAILRKVLNILGVCTIGLVAACAKYGVEISTSIINLKGTVKSKDSLRTIENIQLEVLNSYSESTTNTDENGEYTVSAEIESDEVILRVSDIDGVENGNFISKDTTFNLTSEEIKSGNKSEIEIHLERDE
jgi:putative lipoprotein (rSAM/lipoprotein system)